MTPSIPPDASNYLLLSDVHLGADLVQHTRPWTKPRLQEALRIDHDLGAMLDHYRGHREGGLPWRLIIAGDFIDLTGMSISVEQGAALQTPLTDDELAHGLGNAEDHATLKMRAVAARHDLLFRKLAAFVHDGNSLVFVRGNHDVELYWESVQRAFVEALSSRAPLAPDDAFGRKLLSSRIEFRHWFFYAHGLLYVEHGHQYDATCAYENVLAPRSPRDPRRIAQSFSDILVRYVVRPTKELSTDGHEDNSIFDYLRLAFSLGLHGCAMLGYRFFSAVGRMVSIWRERLSAQAAQIRQEHDERLQQIAARLRLNTDSLRALTRLWAIPVTGSLYAIFRSVFLDGLAAAISSSTLIATLSAAGVLPLTYTPAVLGTVMLAIFIYMKSCRVLEPIAALRRGAAKVAQLMPARYIVMGHTHRPVMEPLDCGASYVNLGNWTADLSDERAPKAPCTHLVIRHMPGAGPHAALCIWDAETGVHTLKAGASVPVLRADNTSEIPLPAEGEPARPSAISTPAA